MISKPFNQNQIVKLYLIVITVLLFTAAPSLAQVTFTNDEVAFNASNPGLAVQDFESGNVAPSGVTGCSQIINENTNDLCFSPGDILPGIQFEGSKDILDIAGPAFTKNPFIVLITDALDDSVIITFPGNRVNAVGVDIGCVEPVLGSCSDDVLVQVFGEGDALIGSTTVAVTNLSDTFLGIKSNELITGIILNADPVSFEDIDRVSLERILFGLDVDTNIPTLSEWGIMATAAGLMLVGIFFAAKRRKAVVNS